MNVFTGIVLYLIIYWTALFAVLPWGNRAPDNPDMGHATGAPANPRIKQKFFVTAIVAAILWLIVFAMIKMDVLDFYRMAKEMSKQEERR